MIICLFILQAALSLVKEVANHANDIMKHGVRTDLRSFFYFHLEFLHMWLTIAGYVLG